MSKSSSLAKTWGCVIAWNENDTAYWFECIKDIFHILWDASIKSK